LSSVDEISAPATGAYLGLGEASRLLGITPSTLRRWADRGQIASFTTPGGHRRFPHTTIVALLPRLRPRRPALTELGTDGNQISMAYRRLHPAPGGEPIRWLTDIKSEDRDLLRERGRHMSECLLAHLDADGPASAMANLHEAARHGTEYGHHAALLGATLTEAVEGFLRFRSPFIQSLAATARQRGLDTREATGLLVDAEAAMDKLLISFIEGWLAP